MPSAKEINYAMLLVEENKAVALTNVFRLLQGIVNQGIWKKRDETLITTADLDLATIDQTILDIITGDYALLCLSLEPRGVNPAKAARYNQYVVQTLQIILDKLETLRPTHPRKCASLRKFIKEELEIYWKQL